MAVSDPIAIGRFKDAKDIIKDLATDDKILELMVIRAFRDEKGVVQFRYDHTPMESCFRMAGVLMWAANKVVNE